MKALIIRFKASKWKSPVSRLGRFRSSLRRTQPTRMIENLYSGESQSNEKIIFVIVGWWHMHGEMPSSMDCKC